MKRLLLCAGLLLLLPGCGPDRPPTAPVSGTVTVDGVPLSTGRITFYPTEGRPASGAIAADGSYTVNTFDDQPGALLGEHVVTITATETSGSAPSSFEAELRGEGTTGGGIRWLVDPKYSQRTSSPLRATVERGDNEFDFEVTSGRR